MASAKRTNRDSLVEDVWAKNPKIKEEVGWLMETCVLFCVGSGYPNPEG